MNNYLKINLISLFLFCSPYLLGQQKISDSLPSKDSSDDEFRKILNLQFSKIITGNTFSNIGNYASIKTSDKALSLSASILKNNGNILSIEASGGATEGVAGFFKNGDLNTNISGNATYHILLNPFSNNTIKRNSFERDILREELEKVQIEYLEDSLAIEHKKELLDLREKLKKAKRRREIIKDSIKALSEQIKRESNEDLNFKMYSLLYEVDKINLDLILLYRKKEELESEGYFLVAEEKAIQKLEEAVKENNIKVIKQGVEAISIYWISAGYGMRNDGFKFFDPTMDYANQIKDIDVVTHQFNAAFSHYNWDSSAFTDTYWSVGVSFQIGNNLSSLDNVKVRDFEKVSSEPAREKFSEQSVFTGTFKEDLNELKVFFDYYKFFKTNDKNSFALHINPFVSTKESVKPNASLRSGIVIPFTKVDDSNSFLNLEIFYDLNDLFNTSASENSLLNRNMIGIAATFPIKFFNPKSD